MKLTQELVDENFKIVKEGWDRMVRISGQSEAMFVITNKDAHVFLALYQEAKEEAEQQGLVMPELVEGLHINIEEDV